MPNAATLAQARAQGADAPTVDATLQQLLDAGWSKCLTYLPAEVVATVGATPASTVPGYVLANIYAARDLWTAFRVDGDTIAFDSYAVRVRELSSTVKGLLRPDTGRPSVG